MFRIFTLFSILITLAVLVSGNYVRLQGADLACPDWPTCYGQLLIGSDAESVVQAQQLFPDKPLQISQVCKQLTNRYTLAALVLFSLILLALSLLQKRVRNIAIVTSLTVLVLSGLQLTLSMWINASKAMPIVQLGFVLNGLLIFWLLCWLFWRIKPGLNKVTSVSGFGGLVLGATLLLFLHITLGVWVSVNNAALVCPDFPQCNGSWWPTANYQYALDIFNGLLTGYSGDLSYSGQIAVHWLHRISSLPVFLVLSVVMFSTTSSGNSTSVRRSGMVLGGLLLLEICLGIATIKLGAPVWVLMVHHVIAALMMLPLIFIGLYRRYTWQADTAALHVTDVLDEIPAETIDIELSPATTVAEEFYEEPEPETLYLRLKSQLKKTRSGLGSVLASIPLGQKTIDEDVLEQIEISLIMADVGIDATTDIITNLTARVERSQLQDADALFSALKSELMDLLAPSEAKLEIPQQDSPFVIMVVGVNGVGKTTTIGKLAKRLQAQGHSVMLAAGDTFRAAAVEQLQAWGERNKIHVVAQHTGADSASVLFDGVQSAKAKNIDVLIADTAGRLHTKSNLMEELKKIKRIMAKVDEHAPHEVLLVLDAGTGQNALSQTKQFNETVALTGIAVTKLDGTAKGGVIFALAKQFGLPIRYIGVGEGIDDLQDFHAEQFVDALFESD